MSDDIPAHLTDAGRRLWVAVTDGLEFRPDEYAVLAQACATADAIATLEHELSSGSVMIAGSRGQDVLHPAVAELRQQRALLASLLSRLDIPETDAAGDAWDGLSASQRARRAAHARWSKPRAA